MKIINIGKYTRVQAENGTPIKVLELCDLFAHNIHKMMGVALSEALLGDKVAKRAYDAGTEAMQGINAIREFYEAKGDRPVRDSERKMMTDILGIVQDNHNLMMRILG